MAASYGSSDKSRWSIWPSDVEPYYPPAVFVALGASVGVIVGTLAPWRMCLCLPSMGSMSRTGGRRR